MTSRPGISKPKSWMESDLNKPLWPYSVSSYNSWKNRSVNDIRQALRGKVSHQASVVREQVFASGEREEGGKKEGV
jgi:putative membrane protein